MITGILVKAKHTKCQSPFSDYESNIFETLKIPDRKEGYDTGGEEALESSLSKQRFGVETKVSLIYYNRSDFGAFKINLNIPTMCLCAARWF